MLPPTTRLFRCVLMLFLCGVVFTGTACSGKKNSKAEAVELVEDTGPTAQEHFTRGNIDLDATQWQAAIAAYDEALSVDPKHWESHMNRGIALSRLGKFSEALSAFEEALRAGGDQHHTVYFNLGNLYQDRGMYSASVDAYRAALAFDEDKVDTLVNLGAAYLFLRDHDAATQTYQHVRGLASADPRPIHGLALVAHIEERYQEAADLFSEALRLDPNFALSYFSQAQCYFHMKRFDDAIHAIDQYITRFPDSRHIRRAEAMKRRYLEEKTRQK